MPIRKDGIKVGPFVDSYSVTTFVSYDPQQTPPTNNKMKFLVCIALCLAVAQAHLIQAPAVATYAAPYTTYSAGVAPVASVYSSPLSYSPYVAAPTVLRSAYSAPAVYSGYSAPVVSAAPSVYAAAPQVYSAPAVVGAVPSVYSTLLKK